MLLKITHTTDLTYSDAISESVMELRMVPARSRPAPPELQPRHRARHADVSYFDWLGNTVHAFTINAFHNRSALSRPAWWKPSRSHQNPPSDVWPVTMTAADYAILDFLQFDGPVVDSPSLRELVEQIAPREAAASGELAMRIIGLLGDRFAYQKGVTTAASPITEMLEHGGGVCQDFTHLMIGIARAMKIPARYVSGFLHPEAGRFRGYTQTHAWCELYFPSRGWIGFDPANSCRPTITSSKSPSAAISATCRPTKASTAAKPPKTWPSKFTAKS